MSCVMSHGLKLPRHPRSESGFPQPDANNVIAAKQMIVARSLNDAFLVFTIALLSIGSFP